MFYLTGESIIKKNMFFLSPPLPAELGSVRSAFCHHLHSPHGRGLRDRLAVRRQHVPPRPVPHPRLHLRIRLHARPPLARPLPGRRLSREKYRDEDSLQHVHSHRDFLGHRLHLVRPHLVCLLCQGEIWWIYIYFESRPFQVEVEELSSL
jgi:hypothetical protein